MFNDLEHDFSNHRLGKKVDRPAVHGRRNWGLATGRGPGARRGLATGRGPGSRSGVWPPIAVRAALSSHPNADASPQVVVKSCTRISVRPAARKDELTVFAAAWARIFKMGILEFPLPKEILLLTHLTFFLAMSSFMLIRAKVCNQPVDIGLVTTREEGPAMNRFKHDAAERPHIRSGHQILRLNLPPPLWRSGEGLAIPIPRRWDGFGRVVTRLRETKIYDKGLSLL